MDEIENAFPMDFYVRDPSPRPWKFRPEGYLVVILSDADKAQRAEASLVSHGFVPQDVKLYTGKPYVSSPTTTTFTRATTAPSDRPTSTFPDAYEGCGYE